MYTQPQPTTLPSITDIGKGVDNYNSTTLNNGDMLQHHIKQEQDFEQTLPPIRTTPINHNNNNNNSSNHSRMSINQLCNNIESDYPEEVKEVAEVLENMKTLPPIPSISNISSPPPQPLEPRPHAEPSQLPTSPSQNSPSAEAGFMSRLGEIPIVKRTIGAYESVSASTSDSSKVTRSRWQQMVIGTGAAVGAAGAVVSEESMKSLKYCLQWINYATQHIDAQIVVLKEFIVNLTNPSNRAVVHTSSTSTLASIKKEVIETLRKVIEVVSKYAGACLPDHAKRNVRSFILNLPTRWASINHTEHSSSPSPMSSPQLAPAGGHPLNQTTDYARRLLSLATESLEMLRSVAGIFGETVGKAEALLEGLKVVGFTSGAANTNNTGNSQFDNIWSSQANGSSNGYNMYSSPSTSSSSSRSRRSSSSARMNSHGPRKHSRTTPVIHQQDDDDDSILNGHDSDSSSDSEIESMRMEMDNAQKRALKNANAKSQQQHANGVSNGTKKRKKGSKKENDRMDLS